jgi:type VI protein secretion system component Hcp
MASIRSFLPRSLVAGGALTIAVLAAILTLTTCDAGAAAVKPKPVIGQLVLDGGPAAPVTGFAWSVTADSSWTKGGGASVGKPQPGSLRITKPIDASSVPALGKIVLGSSFATGVLTLTFGKGASSSTMIYEMDGLYVTELTQGGEDGLSAEDLSMVFKKVKWTFTDAQGNVSNGAYDVTTANN